MWLWYLNFYPQIYSTNLQIYAFMPPPPPASIYARRALCRPNVSSNNVVGTYFLYFFNFWRQKSIICRIKNKNNDDGNKCVSSLCKNENVSSQVPRGCIQRVPVDFFFKSICLKSVFQELYVAMTSTTYIWNRCIQIKNEFKKFIFSLFKNPRRPICRLWLLFFQKK